ncbi:hypothetical protein AKJ37_03235 [candidate division MSBL1 archaeon SCGC-AAA259I09]|uniref:Trimethylamine methyltransferase n=1 Tax=candidate division MSBL1 archaeon SCGC-AAA259I09 TaxID=1698267 RepID=A0A133UT43_9EURY|nr:hypothetical protein AKJ37_03235 [candidate division MSBL1 archaeon SCGC-AAA259I09]
MNVLEKTGVRFEDELGLDLLEENGCSVDHDNMIVKFPPSIVEKCIRKAPSSFRLRARESDDDIILGGEVVYFTNSCGKQTVDLNTFEPQKPMKSDYIDFIKILDALPNCHLLSCYPYYGFKGVPSVMRIPEGVAQKIRYSTKPQYTCYSKDCEIFNIKMIQKTGGESLSCLTSSPPLTWDRNAVMQARRNINAGFPLDIWDGCSYGATGPATFAGSVITSNAEILSMLVFIQLLDSGHRCKVADFSFPLNMRSGSPGFGQIGTSINNAIFNQVWRRYGLPIGNHTPGYSSGKSLDFQVGSEKAINGIIAALSGANVIEIQGSISSEQTAHPVQAILDDDIAGMIGRFIEGEKISDETMATDIINNIGPIPGNYLNTNHTRKYWKTEQFVSKTADRLTYSEWLKKGKKGILDNAKKRKSKMLDQHEVSKPLTEEEVEAIETILEEAGEYYYERGLISDEEWEVYEGILESFKI